MLFVLDNFDSFTFNLVQYIGELGVDLEVARNDEVDVEDIAQRDPAAVLISPGPGTPSRAGISIPLVQWCVAREVPLLGVCLGHQAIGEAFGGRIVRAARIMHGKTSQIFHRSTGVLSGLPSPFEATRYHSLVIEPGSLPAELEVTAWTTDGVVMAVSHQEIPVHGVQFHPESILTSHGRSILGNFVRSLGLKATPPGPALT